MIQLSADSSSLEAVKILTMCTTKAGVDKAIASLFADSFLVMRNYPEVPQWWYAIVFFASLGIGIGCSVGCLCLTLQLCFIPSFTVCRTGATYALVEHPFVYCNKCNNRCLFGFQYVLYVL